jgi:hypothetical protein
LYNILSRSRITYDPKRDPKQSPPEVLHKLIRAFFVPSAETPQEEFV